MPPKRTKKSDSSIQQSTWTVVQRKFTDLVDSQSGFSVSQRRHTLFDYEGLGYTSLKLDSNLMKKLEGGKVQKTLSNMIKYSAKADEKDKGSSFVFQKEGPNSSTPIYSDTRSAEGSILY
jgi:negative regulator of genetic competence, sporulation and motility